jgi:molybdopterin molybdotransferase
MATYFDVRMRGFRERADLDDAVALVLKTANPLSVETVPLPEAMGRALAREAVAEYDVPGFDRAAMDGYALRADGTVGAGEQNPLSLSVVGEAMPGRPFAGEAGPGQAVRIMTGAPLPAGADAVLPVEQAREEAGQLRVVGPIAPGRNVGRRGEDVASGARLFAPGRVLRPQDLGLLASAGVGSVFVHRVPKVSIVITGDELLPVGLKPSGFQIVDSNSLMLSALVRRDGGEPEVGPIVPDRRDALREALLMADGDVVLVSGGSSVGQEDHAPSLVAAEGEILFHGVALRPAGPAGLGTLRGRIVFLLPGNPVSCLCAYDLFAGRALRRMVGRPVELPYFRVRLPLAARVISAVGRVDYLRVRIEEGRAHPVAVSGASVLSTTTVADGFVLVPRDSEGLAEGDEVTVYLYGAQP